jgi:SAM-dependent methyltransferase
MDAGYDVCALDNDPVALSEVMRLAAQLNPSLPPGNFRLESVEGNSFNAESFDVVLSSAVLHFAHSDAHFGAMVTGGWRVLKPGGVFFARLASSIGMESRMKHLINRRYELPDGSQRFLVDEPMLMEWTRRLGGKLLDPLKTTVVQDQRCMTTWVVRKND